MLAIFFPHLFEDVEYLVPAEDLSIEMAVDQTTSNFTGSRGQQSSFENAVAGPSRLG